MPRRIHFAGEDAEDSHSLKQSQSSGDCAIDSDSDSGCDTNSAPKTPVPRKRAIRFAGEDDATEEAAITESPSVKLQTPNKLLRADQIERLRHKYQSQSRLTQQPQHRPEAPRAAPRYHPQAAHPFAFLTPNTTANPIPVSGVRQHEGQVVGWNCFPDGLAAPLRPYERMSGRLDPQGENRYVIPWQIDPHVNYGEYLTNSKLRERAEKEFETVSRQQTRLRGWM
jgi:hypothetical protein